RNPGRYEGQLIGDVQRERPLVFAGGIVCRIARSANADRAAQAVINSGLYRSIRMGHLNRKSKPWIIQCLSNIGRSICIDGLLRYPAWKHVIIGALSDQ